MNQMTTENDSPFWVLVTPTNDADTVIASVLEVCSKCGEDVCSCKLVVNISAALSNDVYNPIKIVAFNIVEEPLHDDLTDE
jgi:hypothetical protein